MTDKVRHVANVLDSMNAALGMGGMNGEGRGPGLGPDGAAMGAARRYERGGPAPGPSGLH